MDTLSNNATEWLRHVLGADFRIEKHSFSHQDDVFTVQTASKTLYLKVSDNLRAEHDNLRRIKPFVSVPDVISYAHIAGRDYLLINEIPGKNLAEFVGTWPDATIVRRFAQAVRTFHALDSNKVFPGHAKPGLVVLHGDMSLPNVIFAENEFSGYIDVGQVTVGTADIDLADAIWSLQRNIGPGFGEIFLQEYGPTPRTEKIKAALNFRYKAG